MNDTSCVKQVRSLTLRFHGDLIQPMAETLSGVYTNLPMGFPGSSVGKEFPAMQGTQVRSLGGEDPLEKEMATHSGVLAWRIPWTEKPVGLQCMGPQRVRHN